MKINNVDSFNIYYTHINVPRKNNKKCKCPFVVCPSGFSLSRTRNVHLLGSDSQRAYIYSVNCDPERMMDVKCKKVGTD